MGTDVVPPVLFAVRRIHHISLSTLKIALTVVVEASMEKSIGENLSVMEIPAISPVVKTIFSEKRKDVVKNNAKNRINLFIKSPK